MPGRLALTLAFVAQPLALAACETDATPASKVEIVAAPPTGEVPPWVFEQTKQARERGRDVLVYVGASWCEPCQHFHDAATSGRLDVLFPRLTLLEFDQDRDEDRLTRAGYLSEYIPLFVRPRPDGTAGSRFLEGSVKGEGAIVDLVPRLRALLAN